MAPSSPHEEHGSPFDLLSHLLNSFPRPGEQRQPPLAPEGSLSLGVPRGHNLSRSAGEKGTRPSTAHGRISHRPESSNSCAADLPRPASQAGKRRDGTAPFSFNPGVLLARVRGDVPEGLSRSSHSDVCRVATAVGDQLLLSPASELSRTGPELHGFAHFFANFGKDKVEQQQANTQQEPATQDCLRERTQRKAEDVKQTVALPRRNRLFLARLAGDPPESLSHRPSEAPEELMSASISGQGSLQSTTPSELPQVRAAAGQQQSSNFNEQLMSRVAKLQSVGESVGKAVVEKKDQLISAAVSVATPRASREPTDLSDALSVSGNGTGEGPRNLLGGQQGQGLSPGSAGTPPLVAAAPDTPAVNLRVKVPSAQADPAKEAQTVTAGVMKSIDSLYLSGIAKPVGSLLGPSVEKLNSTLQHVSLKELMDGLQKLAKARRDAVGGQKKPMYPNKAKLSSVQDFFMYAEAEGRRLFDELDFDADGQVTLQDLEAAMRKRRLPRQYAREMLQRARPHWLAKSFGWAEFQALMEQKEPSMLKAFTSLEISSSGTLKKEQVLACLKRAGLPATDDNARAMMRFLDADGEKGHVTYGQFRNFMLLLPPERITSSDPSMVWFEAATVVPMGPPVQSGAGTTVLRSALAGGLASGLSTCMMHPLDTVKTRVQASSATLGEVLQSVPKLGLQGLYRGATPAILGQFTSHGLRTGMFEATRMLLHKLNPNLHEYQVQPVASFCSTVLGTAFRIPCEVLKQRLQAGMYTGVGDALSGTLKEDGVRGLFRGTTATLLREVPFYVFGMLIYQQVKKATKRVLRRELAPWETIMLGGVSGGLAAVAITPFDVIKTRMMVAPKGSPSGLVGMGMDIVSKEGFAALYKGALPRFFWIAPLGAMNFAGYELAKQAMEEGQEKEALA